LKIIFAGDLNFRGIEPMTEDKSKRILKDVMTCISDSDFRIINLETPLAERTAHEPIYKSGPNLIGMPSNIVFLKEMGIDGVTLANNHIGDFGEKAVEETLGLLDKNNILHAGAGVNIDSAYMPMIMCKDGVTVSILSVCENEFGMAEENKWGSAGYNPRKLLQCIRKEKASSDYVIVCFHGGNEFCPIPSPRITERYRMICDMGADAVIAGHTHCPQGYEMYNGKPIVYSMGNFLFRSSKEKTSDDTWFYGYMCKLTIREGIDIEPIPYCFTADALNIKIFEGEEKLMMLGYLSKLSEPLNHPDLLKSYFEGWSWMHRWCPALPTGNDKDYNASGNFNLVSCEAHCDQLRTVLEIYYRGETEKADIWSKKIKEIQKVPV